VVAASRIAIQRVEEMREREREREREKREKERARPGILAYVRRADTSADEHKLAGLRGGRDALCSSTNYIRRFKNR
jgi:hypothetical protein